jgi:hypothetical protein
VLIVVRVAAVVEGKTDVSGDTKPFWLKISRNS